MRLIDADEILTGIEELKTSPWATEPYMFHHELAVKEALEIVRDLCVNQAPTVDAVPVVRCKDCVTHGNCLTEDTSRIAKIGNPFCCAGKRREDTP